MKQSTKNGTDLIILSSIILIVFIILPYFWRKNEAYDIKENSQFTIGKITRFSRTLKSGDYWHYGFKYKDSVYENSRSTHVEYDIKIGDYFLVNFSSKDPEHSKILYEYKLNDDRLNYIDSVWDTIPLSILHSGLKK